MSFEILIATMYQPKDDYSLLDRMNIKSDAVVVNQCDRFEKKRFKHMENNILWIDTKDRGLSRSRNTALNHATSDICLLADDDEVMIDGYKEVIENAFLLNPGVGLIRFRVIGIERPFKVYPKEPSKINIRSSFKMSSVEIAFNRRLVVRYRLKFDELIGAGTEFLMGEENAFIADYLRSGGKACYQPFDIANLHIGDSTWFTGFNKEYFFARGAAYAAISDVGCYLLCILFALTHREETEIHFFQAISIMHKGIHTYRLRKRQRLKNNSGN